MTPSKTLPRLLAGLAVAAALVPAAASAVPPQEIDDLGNTTNDTTIEVDNPDGPGTIEINTAGDSSPNDFSSCTFVVKGRLTVRNPTVDGLSSGAPIEGVEVKVSGRSNPGFYNEWDTDVTNSNGEFSVTKGECSNRKIKVEARFESDDLRVTSSGSESWYLLHETSGTISPQTLDLFDEPFGGETGEQSTTQARIDAQTWIVYQRAMDYTAGIGHPFLNKVKVYNPATLTVGPSATDPLLDDIHIDSSDTNDVDTLLHELGHAYLYPHVTGEGCLTFDLLLSGDVHQAQESSCVAFNEGFAEYFADKLEQELNADGRLSSSEPSSTTTPMNRADLSRRLGLNNLTQLALREDGWEQVLRVLTSADITRHLFGTATGAPGAVAAYTGTGCSGMPMTLGDLDDALDVIGSDMSVSGVSAASFLGRADNRLSVFDATDAQRYLDAIDPAKTSEPHTAYGC
jgi:hypothetical protein